MPTKKKTEPSPLTIAAEAFDESLRRFAVLATRLGRIGLDSQRDLGRAGQSLAEVADCEEEMQRHAQALMGALATARDAQQAQADQVRARAEQIRRRTEEYATILGRFEDLGKDATALNETAVRLGARPRSQATESSGPALITQLDELQERMAKVIAAGETLAADARAADFAELSSRFESLGQQLRAARNKIVALKEALVRAIPAHLVS